ncbi:MAG: sulfurtransferase [Proteobacteria bacterium]|nr:MAG: sulfurtransferase [Pseudomonadota bacterium]PIE40285.1 MAG: sulfurtransferase [Gammaproteobacteria bacterium]
MKTVYLKWLAIACLLLVQPNAYSDDLGVSVQQLDTILQKNRDNIVFIDVRDPVEIMFTGFTNEVDSNIPYLMVNRNQWDSKKNRFKLFRNPDFVKDIKALLKKKHLGDDAMIVTMCRSGSERGKPGALYLRENGFPNARYVIHGFQGGKVKEGPKKGFRIKNGWQNSGLPWQAKPDAEKIYRKKM